jgi:hypothetical protein
MATLTLLQFHIVTGLASLLAGAAALAVRKGFGPHRAFGRLFAVIMLGMTASSVWLAIARDQPDNIIVGGLTFYLVATGWMAAVRGGGGSGWFDRIALLGVLSIAATALVFALQAANHESGLNGGVGTGNFLAMAAIGVGFAGFDLKTMCSGGVVGAARTSRHLWRLGLAMFMATLSLFVGQPQVFPGLLRDSYVLLGPVVVVAGVVLFWLVKVRWSALPIRFSRPKELIGTVATRRNRHA